MIETTSDPDVNFPSSFQQEDNLLQCFLLMAKLLKKPLSEKAIRSTIPVGPSGLTPGLLIEAFERHNFKLKVVNRKLKEVPPYLPCILILRGKMSCVIQKMDKERATLYFPSHSKEPQTIPLLELEEMYTGKAILMVYNPEVILTNQNNKQNHWFWGTLKLFYPLYVQIIWSSLFINSFVLVGTLYAMNIYDRVLPNKAYDTLFVLSVGVGIVYFVDFVLRTIRGNIVDRVSKDADFILGDFLYSRILNIKLAHRPPSSGGLAHYLKEFENVREFFSSTTILSMIDIPFAIIFMIAIWAISPTMAIIPFLGILLIILVNSSMRPSFKGSVHNLLEHMEYKHATLMESLAAIETVKSLNAEGQMLYKWQHTMEQTAQASEKVHKKSLMMSNISFLIQNLCYVGMIIMGVLEVSSGRLTVGGLIAITILASRSIASAGSIAAIVARANQAKIALNMLDAIINLPSERSTHLHYIPRHDIQGEIEFIDVNFKYPHQERPTLNNLSFKIGVGEKVAFMGKMGSGKSTIAKLILGLYEPTSGTILIDGIDVTLSDPADIRAAVGYVAQDIDLFRGTLRDNVLVTNPKIDDEHLLNISKLAGVDDFAIIHPKGYEMPIGESGLGLSRGQRQTVGIARALMRNPKILLLDEPSTAMDEESESNLIDNLKTYVGNKTLILITHSKKLISLVDRIIILDQGNIISDSKYE